MKISRYIQGNYPQRNIMADGPIFWDLLLLEWGLRRNIVTWVDNFNFPLESSQFAWNILCWNKIPPSKFSPAIATLPWKKTICHCRHLCLGSKISLHKSCPCWNIKNEEKNVDAVWRFWKQIKSNFSSHWPFGCITSQLEKSLWRVAKTLLTCGAILFPFAKTFTKWRLQKTNSQLKKMHK